MLTGRRERFVGHAAGERAVADDAHRLATFAAKLPRGGDCERVAEPGGGVRVLHHVVVRLGARGVAAQAAELAQRVEAFAAAGEHLVHVGLVSGVEDEAVARAVEDAMQGYAELDDAEIGTEVAPRARHRVDEELPDLGTEPLQVRVPESAQVVGSCDFLEDHARIIATGPKRLAARGPRLITHQGAMRPPHPRGGAARAHPPLGATPRRVSFASSHAKAGLTRRAALASLRA